MRALVVLKFVWSFRKQGPASFLQLFLLLQCSEMEFLNRSKEPILLSQIVFRIMILI